MTFTHTPAPLCSRWYTPLCAALLVGVVACAGRQPTGVPPAPPPPPAPATSAFLDTVEQRTFNFFWATTNPVNGLVPDRYPTPSFSSIAATGFGLTAYPVGVERGWVTRSQASSRVLVTLRFLWKAPQGTATSGMTGYQGFYYHFLDMQSGARYRDV